MMAVRIFITSRCAILFLRRHRKSYTPTNDQKSECFIRDIVGSRRSREIPCNWIRVIHVSGHRNLRHALMRAVSARGAVLFDPVHDLWLKPTLTRGPRNAIYTRSQLLGAGEQATIDRTGVAIEPKANIAAATSWLHRELVFQGSPLSQVIQEFNRYSDTPIVLGDPSLGDLRINAVFHTTDPASLLRFLSQLEGVEVQRSTSEIKIARRR